MDEANNQVALLTFPKDSVTQEDANAAKTVLESAGFKVAILPYDHHKSGGIPPYLLSITNYVDKIRPA